MKYLHLPHASAIALSTLLAVTGLASAQNTDAEREDETRKIDEVIVTGVFSASSQKGASVSVSTIDEEDIVKLSPVSAADYLKDVPGVFVNSALGEIRNIVYSRGISANSQDGNNGYFYVSLQEDGLPVQNVLGTNNGPDYYARPDIMTRRIEAVRGGAAAITGPNAPGGIFNYISKNGRDNPGTEIRLRAGSEGANIGENPLYRGEFYHGGSVTDSVHYAIGGFYRDAAGPRYPGYSMNQGGQIRGSLIFEYDAGEVQITGKYLSDHNLWDEFLPVQGFDNPRPLGQFDFNSSVNPPRVAHGFPALDDSFSPGQPTSTDYWDPANGIHNTSSALGVTWRHSVGDRWSFTNTFRFSDNESDWNSGAAIFAMPVNEPGIFGPAPFGNGILAVGTSGPDGVTPFTGVISFADQSTGQVLAQVRSTTDADGAPVFNLLNSSLPDDPALPNAILFQTAFAVNPKASEFIDQFVLTKEFDAMKFDLGFFYAASNFSWRSGEGGVGISQFTPDRPLLDISIERDGADDPDLAGRVQQITSPDGFAGIGKIGSFNNFTSTAKQVQLSVFFGHSWDISDRLTVDWGVRYEKIDVNGSNQSARQFTDTAGGLDGNPDTLYDNTLQRLNFPTRFERTFDYWAYSPAVSYAWSDQHAIYVRFADSQKAPSLSGFIDPVDGVTDVALIPEKVQQFEVGYSYYGDALSLTVTPFYTILKDVGGFGSPIQFTEIDGTNYVRARPLSNLETFGVEVFASYDVLETLNLKTTVTYASAKTSNNAIWNPGNPGRADDRLIALDNGEAINQPNVQASSTGTYSFGDASAYVTWRYTGARHANAANTFQLPAFNVVDFGARYDLRENLSFSFLVKNVFNARGVLSWQGVGGFDGLDRSRTPVDEVWSVVTVQPRAYFLTAHYRF